MSQPLRLPEATAKTISFLGRTPWCHERGLLHRGCLSLPESAYGESWTGCEAIHGFWSRLASHNPLYILMWLVCRMRFVIALFCFTRFTVRALNTWVGGSFGCLSNIDQLYQHRERGQPQVFNLQAMAEFNHYWHFIWEVIYAPWSAVWGDGRETICLVCWVYWGSLSTSFTLYLPFTKSWRAAAERKGTQECGTTKRSCMFADLPLNQSCPAFHSVDCWDLWAPQGKESKSRFNAEYNWQARTPPEAEAKACLLSDFESWRPVKGNYALPWWTHVSFAVSIVIL